MNAQLQAIATILALVNPAICAAIFSSIERGRPKANRTTDAVQASIAVLIILSVAALFGAKILDAFGVSLDAFRVAGGGVLAWMGFKMLSGDASSHQDAAAPPHNDEVSLTPLILFAASPGTITGVITLAVSHSEREIPITALVAVGVAVVTMCAAILFASAFGGESKRSMLRDTITRFMGLIVIAMGVQFGLGGLKSFMN